MSLLSKTHSTDDDLPELTPAQLAELDDLDAILAGDPASDDALAALVRDVRAAAPEMRLEATEQLTGRVAAHFGRHIASRRVRLRGAMFSPVGATACVLLVMATVGGGMALVSSDKSGGGLMGGSDDAAPASIASEAIEPDPNAYADSATSESATSDSATSSGSATTLQARANPSTTAAQGDFLSKDESVATTSGGGGASAASGSGSGALQALTPESDRASKARAVERTVDLSVRVKTGQLEEAAGKVGSITRDANGYVANSDLSLGTRGRGTAAFQLRVDSSKLVRAIDRLSELGTVTAQNESSRDITSSLDSAKSRLDDVNTERKALLRSLAKAESAGQIASLRARIAENRRLRSSLDTQLKQVQRRADLTTISLTLRSTVNGDPTNDDGSWSIGDALGDAGSVLTAILGALLVGGAVLLPFAVLGGLGWLVWAWRRRHARERALDA